MPLPFMGQEKKTIEDLELERDEEILKLEILKSKALQQKLEANGLKKSAFSSPSALIEWFKTH